MRKGNDHGTQLITHRRDESRRKIEASTFRFADIEDHESASVTETAALFRVDPRTVRARIADGTVPATNFGEYRIPVRWIREQLRVAS